MIQEEIQEAGGNLSIMFHNLKPNGIYGQSEENFLRYWREQKDNSKNYLNELLELGKDFDPFITEKERSFMYSCE